MHTNTKYLIQPCASLLLCLLSSLSYGQPNNRAPTMLYFEATGGLTNYSGHFGKLAIGGVFNNRWIATLSYQHSIMKPKEIPGYDEAEMASIPFRLRPLAPPTMNMKSIGLTAGRWFKTGRNTWFTTEGGVSFVSGEKVTFNKTLGHPYDLSYLLFGISGTSERYVYTKEKKRMIGAQLKADLNWAFASFLGLGVGMFANFNSIQSPIGLQLKVIVGKLNRQKRGR